MDQHPIPQNVTGFQFKLIGSMTVKQFGYVAVGVIGATIVYYLPIGGILGGLLKIILIPVFGATGAILAFVPIDGRPIDVMAGNFMKALLSPNQYIYHKGAKRFSFSTIQISRSHPAAQVGKTNTGTLTHNAGLDKSRQLQKLLINSSSARVRNAQDEKENEFLKSILNTPGLAPDQNSLQSSPAKPAPLPNLQVLKTVSPAPVPVVAPAKQPAPVASIAPQKQPLPQQMPSQPKNVPAENPSLKNKLDLENQIKEIHGQKQALEEEVLRLKQMLNTKQKTAPLPAKTKPSPTPVPTPPHVRSVPTDASKRPGIIAPETPNIISGMVKDSRGNVLPNILVEIKDKAGSPVRAFKTNSLGNFASATPLPNGSYTITLEDVKKEHRFDSIQITMNDQIIQPIEITSYDKREELRKELFS